METLNIANEPVILLFSLSFFLSVVSTVFCLEIDVTYKGKHRHPQHEE